MAQRPLIGTSPNQVSTNGMLGDLAFQDSNGAYIETIRGAVNLDKLDKEITDTAVDIFVYDTRKDSDGGAWRKRTQHTSWYNETLNTATRGSRREFPAVAVIVATTNTITIYDGDDPDMPMWMVFNGTGLWNQGLYYSGGGSRCVFALNGIISWGDTPGAFGIVTVNFISEFSVSRTNNTTYGGFSNVPILNRNSTIAATWSSNTYTHTAGTIASVIVNDVAMTVLPNAPIDDATGLPIPTIAVATNGGVSVIKDDGNVANITGFAPTQKVEIDEKYVISTARTLSNDFIFKAPIPSVTSEYNAGFTRTYGGGFYAESRSNQTIPTLRNDDTSALVYTSDEVICMGGTAGVELIGKEINISNTVSQFPNAYISSSYNTGWMHGDIKGAFLSDTDATNVTGTELIIDGSGNWAGDFDVSSDVSAWTGTRDATLSHTGTAMRIVTNGSTYGGAASKSFTTIIGKTYVASINLPSGGGSVNSKLVINNNVDVTGSSIASNTFGTGTGVYNVTFVATSTTTYIHVNGQDLNRTIDVDNVSVRLAEEDRSINNNGLQVFGTITKSAVATGAELVGYSGFNNSNYLVQPYNSNMQTGTGEFSCTVWFKTTSTEQNYEGLVYYNRSGSIGYGWQIMLQPLSEGKGLYFYVFGASAEIYASGIGGLNDGNWHQVVVTHDNGTIKMFIDGTLRQSSSNISAGSINDSQSKLHIGRWYGDADASSYYWRGSIALVRHSASIPSAEQVKKIYEDEKVLFQENAACTLYGSSDAVTALAYDDSTNLLYAGTSSGRSDFQGLRRINNTTTAVTTAISASNGLVAEQ